MRLVLRVRRLWSGGATPLGGKVSGGDFMIILDPEGTCKWHCIKTSNSYSGCKNEQQADFEVKLEYIITDT